MPSDSPDDWRALQDLREADKDKLREKHGLDLKTQIEPFKVKIQKQHSATAHVRPEGHQPSVVYLALAHQLEEISRVLQLAPLL